MKKNKLFGWALVASMMSLSACTNEADEVLEQESEIRLTSEIIPSRVTSLDYQSIQIVPGQYVGVTIIGAKSEHNNVAWMAGTDGTLTNTEVDPIYYGSGVATITAYHPYNSNWTETDNYFSVSTDQSTNEGYLASDLLWTTKQTAKYEDAVTLSFSHKLAKVNVTLTSEDITDLSGATVSICGTSIATYFNPSTGELTANPYSTVQDIKAGITTEDEYTASAIVIPQTLNPGTKFIKVNLNGKTYYYTLYNEKVLEPGFSYSYTLNVKEKTFQLVDASNTINDWNKETGNTGDAEETEIFTTSTVAEMPFQDNEGTYLISSASNLKWFMNNCKSNYASANYKLTTDIYFDNTSWSPVYFNGNFDGGNHTLENIEFDGYDSGSYGFFSSMSGTVKNIVFKNPTIEQTGDNDYYGVLSGVLAARTNGTIVNCGVIGGNISVSSTSRARVNGGGLISVANTGATIKGCYVIGTTIKSSSGNSRNSTRLGGLIGSIGDDGTASNINITSCYTKDVRISGYESCTMGTFIGDAYNLSTYSVSSEISNCYYDNSIDAIGRTSSSYPFTLTTFEALSTDNFAAAIVNMNAKLTDCDYIFGEDGLFIKKQ